MPRGHAPFAVLNRSGNRAITLLLRSPLHGLASGRLALITVTGRRTGARHTFPVGYSARGDRVTIPVGWPERKVWWRNLRGGAPVELLLHGQRRRGHAEVHGSEASPLRVDVQLEPRAG